MWNFFDLSNCVMFLFYFFARMFDQKYLIPTADSNQSIYELTFWVILNTLLVIQACIKILFYMRVYDNFNLLVELVVNVVVDV